MQCPPNSHYERCGPVCPESCIQYHCPLNCCVEGCFCDDEYVMGFNGSCIREEYCFDASSGGLPNEGSQSAYPRRCGPHEYIGCRPEGDCWNYRYIKPRSDACTLGCICVPPLIRGPDGNCILPEQCPFIELTDAAVRDWTICNFMRVINPEADCIMPGRKCDNPERCFDDEDDDVIRPRIRNQGDNELEPCFPELKPERVECPPGEEFVECGPICFASCVQYDCPLKCCVSGCYCPEGQVRGPRGVCIPEEDCPVDKVSLSNSIHDTYAPAPMRCRSDEIISCDSHCQTNCTNYYSEFVPCTDTCVLGCVCRPPKIRGSEGDCVLPEQCHPRAPMEPDEVSKLDMLKNFIQIKENAMHQSTMDAPIFKCLRRHETLNMCTYTCPDTCDNYQDRSRICKRVCLPIPRCDCEEGYVRGPSGDCITPEECPNEARMPEDCTGLEYYDPCGPACEIDCTSFYEKNSTCENGGCRAGCFCKRGLARGPDGKCMWPFECFVRFPQLLKDHRSTLAIPDTFECPENEEWKFCGTACPKNCSNYDESTPCVETCSKGCFCKEPYVRGPDGRCVLAEECPSILRASSKSVCPENEVWEFSCTFCPRDCTNYQKNDTSCIPICGMGCFCKEPFVIGPNGTCISTDQCPPVLKASHFCPENEYFEECEANCEKDCTNYDQKIPCSSFCRSGCVCKPPLVRGPDSTCVSVEECPERKTKNRDSMWSVRQFPAYICKENEAFTFCKSICPDNCNNHKEERFCKHICLPGCACRPGYVLSRDGACIKQEHCVDDRPDDCSELEEFNECGSFCETDCFNFNMASRDCYTKECRKGCFCKPGWVRSPDMKCIRPYECPRRSSNAFRHSGREWPL